MDNFFYFNIDCPHKRLEYFKEWVKSNYKMNYSHLFYQAITSHDHVLRNNFEIIKYFVDTHDINPNEYIKYYRNGIVYGYYCPVIESATKGDLEIVQYFISLIAFNVDATQQSTEWLYGKILYASSSMNKINVFDYIAREFLTLGAEGMENKIEQLKKIMIVLYECILSFKRDQRVYIEESAIDDDDHILLLPRHEALILVNHKLKEYRQLFEVLKKELNEQYKYSVKGVTNQNNVCFAEHLIMSYLMV